MFALSQLVNFLEWAGLGFGIFLCAEVLYLVRFAFGFDKIATFICDIALIAALFFCIIFFAAFVGDGSIYYYSYLGLILGSITELLLVHKIFAKGVQKVYNVLRNAVTSAKSFLTAKKSKDERTAKSDGN